MSSWLAKILRFKCYLSITSSVIIQLILIRWSKRSEQIPTCAHLLAQAILNYRYFGFGFVSGGASAFHALPFRFNQGDAMGPQGIGV